MSVLDVQVTTTGIVANTSGVGIGLTQQLPVQIYISTNDTLATVSTTGYLNTAVTYFQYPFNNYQMALVETSDQGPTWMRVLKQSNGAGGYNYSLEETVGNGSVAVPTVANQITYAVNTAGGLAASGLSTTLFNAGNISAGDSGTAGELLSYPATAATGSLGLKAVANSGNYANVISNASTAQATTWNIPDPGVSSTSFLLTDSAGTQTITSGNLTIDGSLTVDGVLAYSALTVGVGSAAAPSYTFSGRTNTGMYSSAANVLDFATDGTRQLSVGGGIVAVNYLQIEGSVASSPVLINTLGTDTNVSLQLVPKGTGQIVIPVGAATTPSIGFAGRLATGMYSSAAATIDFVSTGGENLQIADSGGTTVNYATITGSATATPVLLGVAGSDTNISLEIVPKGTGQVLNAVGAVATPAYSFVGRSDVGIWSSAAHTMDFSTNSLRVLQLIQSPSSSVNYMTVTPASTGNPVLLGAIGSDTNVSLEVVLKGSGNFNVLTGNIQALAGNIDAGSSGNAGMLVSYPGTATEGTLIFSATSNAGGNFSTTVTNASSVGQGQTISIPDGGTGSSNFLISNSAGTQTIATGNLTLSAGNLTLTSGNITLTSGNYIITSGIASLPDGTAAAPSYTFTGRTNTGVYSSAANTLDFATDGTRQLSVGGAIVAVNYLQVQGSIAASPVLLNALGTDTNIGITLTPKGSGALTLTTGNFVATAGNVTAGSSGNAGTVTSFPGTATKGSLILAAVANTGNTTTTISNDAMGQASVVNIPDPGNAIGQFVVGATATPFVSGNFPKNSGTAGLMVDSGVAVAELMQLNTANVMATGGSITLLKANGTESSNAVTADGQCGVITTSSLSTAGGGSYAITWTNTSIATTSVILLTVMGGTNSTENITLKASAGSGSSTLTIYNNTAATALNGTIFIGYAVF